MEEGDRYGEREGEGVQGVFSYSFLGCCGKCDKEKGWRKGIGMEKGRERGYRGSLVIPFLDVEIIGLNLGKTLHPQLFPADANSI